MKAKTKPTKNKKTQHEKDVVPKSQLERIEKLMLLRREYGLLCLKLNQIDKDLYDIMDKPGCTHQYSDGSSSRESNGYENGRYCSFCNIW